MISEWRLRKVVFPEESILFSLPAIIVYYLLSRPPQQLAPWIERPRPASDPTPFSTFWTNLRSTTRNDTEPLDDTGRPTRLWPSAQRPCLGVWDRTCLFTVFLYLLICLEIFSLVYEEKTQTALYSSL